MPRKIKPRVDKIFEDDGSGYVIESIQKPPIGEIEKIEKEGEGIGKKVKQVERKLGEKSAGEYIFVICEKPQAAMKIAYALADIAPVKKNIAGVPYYELQNNYKKVIVASAVGHLFGLAEKEKSQGWPVFDIEWQSRPGFSRKYASALNYLAKNASDFVIACDYDIEGELIGFNVLRFICNREDAKRMKFSTLTKYELQDSFNSMMPHVDFGQAYAGETRHYLDWMYGINLSRALMQAIKAAGSFKILSIGRVQGPSLGLVVSREREIQAFKPEPYWNISLLISNSHELEVFYPKDIKEKKEAEKFLALKGKTGEAKTTKQESRLWPFPPFDLTSLQIESYKFFGFSPAQTLAIAQNLYLRGLISYPRTSSQKLPISIGYRRIIEKLTQRYPHFVKLLTRQRPVEGKKQDPAHPAIFPTGESSEKISPAEKQVYDLIVKRFLACFAEDALLDEKKITVKVDKHEFFAAGKKIMKQGWLEIYPFKIIEKELPDVNGKIKVKQVNMEEKETQPPRRYSSASLVSELEKRGLGTKGTRAMVVDALYKRGYITGRQIQATLLGLSVVDALEKDCPIILDEQLTRKFEDEMDKIREEKEKDKIVRQETKVIDEAKDILLKIAHDFKAHEKEIGEILAKAQYEAKKKEQEANTLFECPVCHEGKLVMIRSRYGKRFAGCNKYPKCKTTFSLPQYGLIKLSDKKCECGWPMLLLIRKGKPPWNFCINPECPTRKAREEKKVEREEAKKAKVKEKKLKKAKKAKATRAKTKKKSK